ncbi:MAG: hypothetical protein QOE58_2344 [Actinomycetota bacterium]|jgi:hypothetical protein|nr:hypothetical protein [Actinomycetota bacterium]
MASAVTRSLPGHAPERETLMSAAFSRTARTAAPLSRLHGADPTHVFIARTPRTSS